MTPLTNPTATGAPSPSAIRTVIGILVAAGVTALTVALAGTALVAFEPAAGSNAEAILGLTAAVSGLLTGALVISAAVYAQFRDLWRFAPTWFRLAVIGLVVVAIIRSLIVSLG